MRKESIADIEKRFFQDEFSDFSLYDSIAKSESDKELKGLVIKLRDKEKKHTGIWASLLGIKEIDWANVPISLKIKVHTYLIVRKLLGIAFVTKLLEQHEQQGLEDYRDLVKGVKLGRSTREKILDIMADEEYHEKVLLEQTQKHEVMLKYIRSVIFGMNDGLVEILAVVVGIAMVATSSFVVALTGIIVGISGTLSMAAGAYLSSKSEMVVENSIRGREAATKPAREAYYTGIFYFIGALAATYPFILGSAGYIGIAESVLSVIAVLSIVSAIIAVLSDTSIKRRVGEMLAISLGAAFITALIGFIIRVVFGIAISA